MTDKSDADAETPVQKTQPKGGFWRWVKRLFVFGFIGVLVAGFFLPMIAAKLLTQPGGPNWLKSDFPANIEVGGASMGWQSPVYLTDVRVKNKAGEPLAEIAAVTSKNSLWQMITGEKSQSLEVELEGLFTKVVVHEPSLAVSDEPINVGELLRPLLEKELPDPDRSMMVTLVNSEVQLVDEDGVTIGHWKPISGTYAFNKGQQPPHALELTARVAETESASSQLTASLGKTAETYSDGDTLSLIIECEQQPTSGVAPLLRTLLSSDQVMPEVNGALQCVVLRTSDSISLQTNSDLSFADFVTLPENSLVSATSSATAERIQIQAQADYFLEQDVAHVERLYAQTGDVLVDLTGDVQQCSGEAMCQLFGKLQSPAKGIKEMLPEHLRQLITLEDVQLSALSVNGPLNPTEAAKAAGLNQFQVSTDLSWKHAEAFQIKSDNGSLKVILKNNKTVLQPISIPVSGGHLRMLPTIDLQTETPTIIVGEGLMLEKVNLNQEMCRGWLRYISPTMANATSANGQFSLLTTPSQFSADAIDKADLGGVLKIHQAQIGPGPLSNGLLGLVGQIQTILGRNRLGNRQTWVTMNNQDVAFRLVDGRVHHRDFGFMIGDMPLSSSGSVGLDETLNLVVTMALPDKWFEGKPVLQALKGEKLEIYVSGTTNRPQIDGRAIAEFGKRMGAKAAGGLLEKLLNRGR